MLKLTLSCVLIGLVHGGFFDFSEMDDPLAMLWNSHMGQKMRECSTDKNGKGKCMDKSACLLSGGTPTSTQCQNPFFQTCCLYSTNCFQSSKKKEGYFELGNSDTNSNKCQYQIFVRNKNVCQVRLDFEELVLAPTVPNLVDGTYEYLCSNDFLTITPNPYGIPVLCGYNSQQHVYVHFNQLEHPEGSVTIDIHLANRQDDANKDMVKPSWKIKFTQLECPLRRHKFDLAKYGEVENINNDFFSLAPQGAIQYFSDRSGEIRSFGYNATETIAHGYLTKQHYSMAFRRPTSACGLKFSNVHINIFGTSPSCEHYLYVPEVKLTSSITMPTAGLGLLAGSNSDNDYICGSEENIFYSLPPGPLYINFKALSAISTSDPNAPPTVYQGFQMNYDLTPSPQGAIQYFREITGKLRSFGYDPNPTVTNQQYPTGQHYSIAFRRTSNVCGVKFFNANISILTPEQKSNICSHYLLIPEQSPKDFTSSSNTLITGGVSGYDHICELPAPTLFYSLSPGPFYINFKTIGTSSKRSKLYKGFEMDYELAGHCPENI